MARLYFFKNWIVRMTYNGSKLVECTDCNRLIRGHDFNTHFAAKHEGVASSREGRGKCFTYEKDGQSHDLLVITDLDRPVYCCKFCNKSSYSRDNIIQHDIFYHKLSYDDAKEAAKSLPGCNICWLQFYSKEKLEKHYKSRFHLEKEKYVTGTGCDVCKLKLGPVKHEDTKRHKRYANYIPGSGCDKCCISFAELRIIFKNLPHISGSDQQLLNVHRYGYSHSECCCRHVLPDFTEPGACSICKLVLEGINNHFTSLRHIRTEKTMEKILRTNPKKSARK